MHLTAVRRTLTIAFLPFLAVACASPRVRKGVAPAAVPSAALRVYHSPSARFVSFDALAAAVAGADVAYFGEQHDDPETHFAEFALLEAVGRRRDGVVLSLEMFERDVQPALDDYLAGLASEGDFLSRSRPWERYATDYRAMVQLARARGWPVVAANVPRPVASAVSRNGLAALDSLPPAARVHAAREISCPRDAYYERFAEQMKGHGTANPRAPSDSAAAGAMVWRFYEAQCVKDETMAESIAAALARAASGALVVHYDGAFHSDYGLGTVARGRRRLPDAKSLVISAIPVADPATVDPAPFATRGDFIVFTRRPPPR